MILGIFKAVIHAKGVEWVTKKVCEISESEIFGAAKWAVFNWGMFVMLSVAVFSTVSVISVTQFQKFQVYLKAYYFKYLWRYITLVEYSQMVSILWIGICAAPVFGVIFTSFRWRRRRERLQRFAYETDVAAFDRRLLKAEKINRYTDNMLTCVTVIVNNWFEIEHVNDKAFRLNERLSLDMQTPMIGTNFFTTFYWLAVYVKKDLFSAFEKPEYGNPVKVSKYYDVRLPGKTHRFEVVYQPIGNGHVEQVKLFIFDME